MSNFNFLGCNVSYRGETDVDHKVNKFNYITGTLRRTLKNKVRPESVMKLYKTMTVTLVTYCSETWTMRQRHRARIQSAEMRFLRSIAGYTRQDRKTNTSIRQQLQVQELNETLDTYRGN